MKSSVQFCAALYSCTLLIGLWGIPLLSNINMSRRSISIKSRFPPSKLYSVTRPDPPIHFEDLLKSLRNLRCYLDITNSHPSSSRTQLLGKASKRLLVLIEMVTMSSLWSSSTAFRQLSTQSGFQNRPGEFLLCDGAGRRSEQDEGCTRSQIGETPLKRERGGR